MKLHDKFWIALVFAQIVDVLGHYMFGGINSFTLGVTSPLLTLVFCWFCFNLGNRDKSVACQVINASVLPVTIVACLFSTLLFFLSGSFIAGVFQSSLPLISILEIVFTSKLLRFKCEG